jgi:DNA-binding transcriptional LysR family regulator
MGTMPIMDIRDARTFIAVVDAGSVSRAARELHLTQPAVTRRVQRLEHAVGAQLIDRRKRPFALTDIGQAAIERCRRLVSTRDELTSLAQGGIAPTREFRIGVAHALTELALIEPIDEMRQAFPAVVARLYTGWSRDLLERVRSGALDAAVVFLPDREALPRGTDGDALASEQLVVIAPRDWRTRTWTMRDAAEVGWILNPEGCAVRAGLQRLLGRIGLPLRVAVETYNYELQMALVARSRGLGLVPIRLLARSASRKRLCKVRVGGLEFPMTIWMLRSTLSQQLEQPLNTLCHALKERLSRTDGRRDLKRP